MTTTDQTPAAAGDHQGATAASPDAQQLDDALRRRRETIETTGWGAPFRLLQPRNACFWVAIALLVAGLRYLVSTVADNASAFAAAYTASVLSTGAFLAVFLLFLHRADRWEHTPGKLAAAAFLLGGVAVPWAIALPGNSALGSLYGKLFGQPWAEDWQAGLSAPFVEESAKGIAFLLLLGLASVVIRTVYDGLIVGAYVGLGFQVFEDLLYGQNAAILQFGADQTGAVLHTFVARSITGLASHALYTALFAAGLIYLIGTRAQPRRIGRGLALVAGAMLLHGFWDSTLALADGSQVAAYGLLLLITVASFVVLFIALRLAGGRERSWLRDVLTPEVDNGTLTDAELAAVTGYRRDRRAAVRGRADGVSRRREKHVLTAARDLAHDLAASGGDDTPQVQATRGEVARLRSH